MNTFEVVAKFGGTSVAQPQAVRRHVQGEPPDVLVVSAPGLDRSQGHTAKITDMLLAAETDRSLVAPIQQRFGALAVVMAEHVSPQPLQDVIEAIPDDIDHWRQQAWPLAALGEYWSSRMYAHYLDREWVDAADLVRFNNQGELDEAASEVAIAARLRPGGLYLTGGFYGADEQGTIHVLDRGGSNITPALIGRALNMVEYHNWSDVDGFMTRDPNLHEDSELHPQLTYQHVTAMAAEGCQLLHPMVCRLLDGSALRVIMRNTFGEVGNRGTVVSSAFA